MDALRLEVRKMDGFIPYTHYIVLTLCEVAHHHPDAAVMRHEGTKTCKGFTEEMHVGPSKREVARYYKGQGRLCVSALPAIVTTMARRLNADLLRCPEWQQVQEAARMGCMNIDFTVELTDDSVERVTLA